MSISFTKIKFVEKTQTLELGFSKLLDEGGEEKYANVKYPYRPLKKLINVFRQTIPHLIIVSENANCVEPLAEGENHLTVLREWLKEPDGYKDELFGFSVSEIKLVGYGDDKSFSIVGKKKLTNGLMLSLETPPMKIHNEEFPYEFESDLEGIIGSLTELAIDYINGEYDKVGQMFKLFDDENIKGIVISSNEENDEVAEKSVETFPDGMDGEIEGLQKINEGVVVGKSKSKSKKK